MHCWPLAAFGGALAVFHASELVLAAVFMRDSLSHRSLLLSWPYAAAMCGGLAEFWLESRMAPGLKQLPLVSGAGLGLVLLGEATRKLAMVTAGPNFTHDIQHERRPGHTLVTRGVYRYVRHPGYMGWFIWAVGTQVLLANPLCTLVFALVAWRFFSERIAYEDFTLRRFFGAAYDAYAAVTPSGLPFID